MRPAPMSSPIRMAEPIEAECRPLPVHELTPDRFSYKLKQSLTLNLRELAR